ncbi:MAG: menaquinone biosynthesis protein [Pirellulaceae bacterium]|jgi:chorismate dehydratase|nr:menaquinone biosynthesis protein [Pirellulaceae bacterium]
MNQSEKIRIGAVSYLNTKPLIESLSQRCDQIELSLELPSRLAKQLADGDLDVALIPSVEAFRSPDATIVSDACIGCRGPVWSVKLISRRPFGEIRSVALDEGSRTSVGLIQVLLWKRFGIQPIVSSLPIYQDPSTSKCDAVLVIGDRAMHVSTDEFGYQWDLGDQWCQWTELPFVFAMWVTRDAHPTPELIQALTDARDYGVEHIDEIAEREAAHFGLTVEDCSGYLRDNLHFYLGADERKALDLFQSQLLELNLITETKKLNFYECQTS